MRAVARKSLAGARTVAGPIRNASAQPPKRASAQKATARKLAAPAMRREDRAGHLDPRYAAELRSRSDHEPAGPAGFISRPRAKDDLVEGLAEEFVSSANSGEYGAEDTENQDVPEEVGGPFVETTDRQEFARGTDASNPKGATREPFPRT